MADKKRTVEDWEDIRVFLALARYGSLSGAARALSVNHATVSRRLRSLESTLGEKLVERRPAGYLLTPAGSRVLAAADEMEIAAGTLGRGVSADEPRGLVRINAPPALAQCYLIKRLARLPLRYPGIEIDLATSLRSVSLERRETDIAVRLGRPPDAYLLAREVVHMGYGIYAAAQLRRQIDEGMEPAFITFDQANADILEAVWIARHFPRARVSFRTNHHLGQAIAARTGVGVALLPHYIARTTPGLQLTALQPVPEKRDVWLLTRRRKSNDVAIRVAVDYLSEVFASERELFDSPSGSSMA
jgi:DNA-binding transcriptional LysR family regulator